GWIFPFELHQDFCATRRHDFSQFHHRCISNRAENVHVASLFSRWLHSDLCFHFFKASRPVLLKEPRKRAVSEKTAACLAIGTVISLVGCIADPLNERLTSWARLFIAAMDRHSFAKSGHFFRKLFPVFAPQAVRPIDQRLADGLKQSIDFFLC